jgi:hypothetical protein
MSLSTLCKSLVNFGAREHPVFNFDVEPSFEPFSLPRDHMASPLFRLLRAFLLARWAAGVAAPLGGCRFTNVAGSRGTMPPICLLSSSFECSRSVWSPDLRSAISNPSSTCRLLVASQRWFQVIGGVSHRAKALFPLYKYEGRG